MNLEWNRMHSLLVKGGGIENRAKFQKSRMITSGGGCLNF